MHKSMSLSAGWFYKGKIIFFLLNIFYGQNLCFFYFYAYYAYNCRYRVCTKCSEKRSSYFLIILNFSPEIKNYTIILTIIKYLKLFQTIPVKVSRRERTVLRKLRWPPVFAYYSFMFVIHARISLFFLIWFFKHVISSGACTGYQLEGVQPCKVLKFLQSLMKCYWREAIISKEKRILDCKFLIQPLLHVPEPGFRKNKK